MLSQLTKGELALWLVSWGFGKTKMAKAGAGTWREELDHWLERIRRFEQVVT